MKTYSFEKLLLGIICSFHLLGFTQKSTIRFFQPQLQIKSKLSEKHDVSFGLFSRFEYTDFGEKGIETEFIELNHFSSFRIAKSRNFGLGVLYRFAKNINPQKNNEFRLTQQYAHASKPSVVRFSHRFRTEERWIHKDFFMRFRYQFGMDFPLRKEKANGYYSTVNAESLLLLHHGTFPRYDARISAGMGKLLSPTTRLRMTLQYRFEQLTQLQTAKFFLFLGE